MGQISFIEDTYGTYVNTNTIKTVQRKLERDGDGKCLGAYYVAKTATNDHRIEQRAWERFISPAAIIPAIHGTFYLAALWMHPTWAHYSTAKPYALLKYAVLGWKSNCDEGHIPILYDGEDNAEASDGAGYGQVFANAILFPDGHIECGRDESGPYDTLTEYEEAVLAKQEPHLSDGCMQVVLDEYIEHTNNTAAIKNLRRSYVPDPGKVWDIPAEKRAEFIAKLADIPVLAPAVEQVA